MSKWEPPQRVKSLWNAVFVITLAAWGGRCEMYSSTWEERFEYLLHTVYSPGCQSRLRFRRIVIHICVCIQICIHAFTYILINNELQQKKILPRISGCWVNPCCSVLLPQRTSAVMSQTRTDDSGWPELWSPSCLTRCTAEWLSPAKMDGLLGICKQRNMTRWGKGHIYGRTRMNATAVPNTLSCHPCSAEAPLQDEWAQ